MAVCSQEAQSLMAQHRFRCQCGLPRLRPSGGCTGATLDAGMAMLVAGGIGAPGS